MTQLLGLRPWGACRQLARMARSNVDPHGARRQGARQEDGPTSEMSSDETQILTGFDRPVGSREEGLENNMITVTAFKWVPPFAAGQVRDHRVRWMLHEIGWDFDVELIDPNVRASRAHLAEQPFGQVPVLRETGRPALFESGAIVLDLAERSGKLWPADHGAQAQVRCWVIAALNSVEPYLSNVADVDFFTEDERLRALRRPGAVCCDATAGQARGGARRPRPSRRRRVHGRRPHAGFGAADRGARRLDGRASEPSCLSGALLRPTCVPKSRRRLARRDRLAPPRGHGVGFRTVCGRKLRPMRQLTGEFRWSRRSTSSSGATALRR